VGIGVHISAVYVEQNTLKYVHVPSLATLYTAVYVEQNTRKYVHVPSLATLCHVTEVSWIAVLYPVECFYSFCGWFSEPTHTAFQITVTLQVWLSLQRTLTSDL
jgi:hypothetical protein